MNTGAFAYLIARTTRNRIVTMAKRVKQPRYAIGLIVVLVYFGGLFGSSLMSSKNPAGMQVLGTDAVRLLAPAILAIVLLGNWIGGSALGALTFSQAEVATLFPAPVPRRDLIIYKLANAQLPIIFNVIFLQLLWGGGGSSVVPRWLSAIGLYTLFATVHMHRLGAALVRVAAVKHGASGIKRNWASAIIPIVVGGTMMMVIADSGSGEGSVVARITAALSQTWVQVVLLPFSLITGPAFAQTAGEWGIAFLGALAMLGLHLWWVLRSEAAFEEAAAEQSAKLHAMIEGFRKRGLAGAPAAPRSGRLTIPLASHGHPAVAIVWKNTLNFIRTFRASQLMLVMALPIVVGVVVSVKAGDPWMAVAGVCGLMALVILLAGGMSARNDLRADLQHLSSLKSIPLRGREIVLAEVSSSALPLAIMECLLLWGGLAALQQTKNPLPVGALISIALTLPAALAALNLLSSTIQNGVAVLFPAWVKLGAEGPGGIEVMGQAMLALFAMFVSFLLLMVLPALATFLIVAYIKPPVELAIASTVLVCSAMIVAEAYGVMVWLGRVLEKTEPSSVTAS